MGYLLPFGGHKQAKTDLACLQESAQGFVGRERDLLALDQAWHDESTGLFLLTALGGTGKTSLLQRWLARLEAANWLGADNVYAWSFPDVTDDTDVQILTDEFLEHALTLVWQPP